MYKISVAIDKISVAIDNDTDVWVKCNDEVLWNCLTFPGMTPVSDTGLEDFYGPIMRTVRIEQYSSDES